MRLTAEMIPEPCWYKNLRKMLKRKEWDIIRKKIYERAGYKCEICNSQGKLHAHEVWEYDDEKKVQKLAGLIALCSRCHLVKHLAFAEISDRIDIAATQFCTVNDCDLADWEVARDRVREQFRERNRHEWTTDVSWVDNFLKE